MWKKSIKYHDKFFKKLLWLKYLLVMCTILAIIFILLSNSYRNGSVMKLSNKNLLVNKCELINNGLSNPKINVLKIFKDEPTAIYAGTQAGIFKSTNNGLNWSLINEGLSIENSLPSVFEIKKDLFGNLYILAGNIFSKYIFKSSDGGARWENIISKTTNTKLHTNGVETFSLTSKGQIFALSLDIITTENEATIYNLYQYDFDQWNFIDLLEINKGSWVDDIVQIKDNIYFDLRNILGRVNLVNEGEGEIYSNLSSPYNNLSFMAELGPSVEGKNELSLPDNNLMNKSLYYNAEYPSLLYYVTGIPKEDVGLYNMKNEIMEINRDFLTYYLIKIVGKNGTKEVLTKWENAKEIPLELFILSYKKNNILFGISYDPDEQFNLMKSVNEGETWKYLNLTELGIIHPSTISVNPNDISKIYIGTTDSGVYQCLINKF
ncbi:hypothetical protein KAS41_00805 [Candidatus Parcubacteria bacterium]|nr:hypothetical protein [Candidatus Parcubacteria bacterium]